MKRKFLVGAVLGLAACSLVGCASMDYNKANGLSKMGMYDNAIELYEKLGDYKDSAEQINACKYAKAEKLHDDGEFLGAVELYRELGDYKESKKMRKKAACKLIKNYVEENGKTYELEDKYIAVRSRTDKAYVCPAAEEDYYSFIGIQDSDLVIGTGSEVIGLLYAGSGMCIELDEMAQEYTYLASFGVAAKADGKLKTFVSSAGGTIDSATITKNTKPEILTVDSTDSSILEIKDDQVLKFWQDFCQYAPDVLSKVGLTLEDLGFETL